MLLLIPIGFLANSLPVTPGGLGVGEAAMESLFRMGENDSTIFLPLNSSKVRIFSSVSGSSKLGAISPIFNDMIAFGGYPIK